MDAPAMDGGNIDQDQGGLGTAEGPWEAWGDHWPDPAHKGGDAAAMEKVAGGRKRKWLDAGKGNGLTQEGHG